jgi:hypothetical protein
MPAPKPAAGKIRKLRESGKLLFASDRQVDRLRPILRPMPRWPCPADDFMDKTVAAASARPHNIKTLGFHSNKVGLRHPTAFSPASFYVSI